MESRWTPAEVGESPGSQRMESGVFTKMGPQDDLEAFHANFEQVAWCGVGVRGEVKIVECIPSFTLVMYNEIHRSGDEAQVQRVRG